MDFMKLACDEAKIGMNANHGGPFGAVIVRDGQVIGKGHNMVLINNDPTAHAEVVAIRDACSKNGDIDLTGCQLYTSCYPCPMCMGAALWSRVDAIYYAATAEDAAAIGFSDFEFHEFLKNPKSDEKRKIEQLKIANYLEPFNEWQSKQDKKPY